MGGFREILDKVRLIELSLRSNSKQNTSFRDVFPSQSVEETKHSKRSNIEIV